MQPSFKAVFLGYLAASLVVSAAAVFYLKSQFNDIADDLDAMNQNLKEAAEDLQETTENLDAASQSMNRSAGITAGSDAATPRATFMDLCNNTFGWSFNSCSTMVLSDGTILDIEGQSASQRLIETIDDLQSGERESMIGEPLPAEETEQLLLYSSMG